jgi:hypothetical protein
MEHVGGSAGSNSPGAYGLVFLDRPGCAGTRASGDAGRHPCPTPPVGTVKLRVERRQTVRVFVCEAHAVGHYDPRLLTEDDRAELRRRRRRR